MEQKNKRGIFTKIGWTLIPCFGLTGPHNGSDATGSIDKGNIFLDENNNVKIKINLNKRYITSHKSTVDLGNSI